MRDFAFQLVPINAEQASVRFDINSFVILCLLSSPVIVSDVNYDVIAYS